MRVVVVSVSVVCESGGCECDGGVRVMVECNGV